jgi:hypothetical protein
MSRVAAISLLCAAACAHDHALDGRELGEMKNSTAAVSVWPGPVADPIADESADGTISAVVDRVHETTVEVLAATPEGKIQVTSGVLAGGGLVFTDLRALLVEGPNGDLQPANEIAVLTVRGALPARIVGGALDARVAVLELPQIARGLEGPPLAEGPSGDPLLALRASRQGSELAFDVIRFSLQPSEDALNLRSARGLPVSFTGAPAFDMRGTLAGLLVAGSDGAMVLVPANRLLQILDGVHPPRQQEDDRI